MAQANEKVVVYGDSHQGRVRTENEDEVLFVASPLPHKGYLLAVADGVGGQQGGRLASQTLIHELGQAYEAVNGPDITENLRSAIQTANFRAAQQCQGSGGASTLVAAVIAEGRLYLANVGDSRAYLIRDRQAFQLSRDHAAAGGVITRALVADFNAQPDMYPPYPLQPGDRLLLCSDGLHDLAPDPAMLAQLAGRGGVRPAVANLINWANEQGGPDNIAVVLAHFRPAPAGWLWGVLALFLCLLLVGGAWGLTRLFDKPTETPSPIATLVTPASTPTLPPPVPTTPPPTATFIPTITSSPPLTLPVIFATTPAPTATPSLSPTATATVKPISPPATTPANTLLTTVATFTNTPPVPPSDTAAPPTPDPDQTEIPPSLTPEPLPPTSTPDDEG